MRLMMKALALATFVGAGEPAYGEAGPGGRAPCALAECVALAVNRAPALEASRARITAAEAAQASTTAGYGPRLKVDGGVQVWDQALESSLGDFEGLPIEVPAFRIRDQLTWSVNLTLAQPLMGLWTVFEAARLQELGVDVARLETEGELRRLVQEVAEAWLQSALARDLVAVAEASLVSRESDRDRAKALVEGGVLVAAEGTRAELGVQEARQRLAQAQRQSRLADARLAQLVGDARVPTAASWEVTPTPPIESLDAARRAAVAARMELRALELQVQQAGRAVDVEFTQLMPSVNLVAQAQFIGGQQLAANQQAFVGVTFDWTFWDWGGRYARMDELRARQAEAKARMQQLSEGLQLEVEGAWIQWESAVDQAALAAEAEKVAAENYALARARFEANALTAFELQGAEAAVTKAAMDRRVAAAAALVARAQLVRAMGGGRDDIVREATP